MSNSPWSPLRAPTLRNLFIADVLSDVGTFMQGVGAAWLMVSFGAGPMYVALTQTASAFVHVMRHYEHVRRRDGASRWELYRDTEVARRYLETFVVGSWAEHLRQHERLTQSDRKLEDHCRTLVRGEPKAQHFIDARL